MIFIKAYNEDKLKFGLVSDDDAVTASFDVSTEKGKKECIANFKSLKQKKRR